MMFSFSQQLLGSVDRISSGESGRVVSNVNSWNSVLEKLDVWSRKEFKEESIKCLRVCGNEGWHAIDPSTAFQDGNWSKALFNHERRRPIFRYARAT